MAIENKLVFGVPLLLFAVVALEARFEAHRKLAAEPGPYAYATSLFAAASPPVFSVGGDSDENHRWRDRNWWIQNGRAWVGLASSRLA